MYLMLKSYFGTIKRESYPLLFIEVELMLQVSCFYRQIACSFLRSLLRICVSLELGFKLSSKKLYSVLA
jgi:hypothetical protein